MAREQLGTALPPSWEHRIERWLAPARRALDAGAVAVALAEGRAMDLEQAIAEALAESGDRD
jgi:hypothetical protein